MIPENRYHRRKLKQYLQRIGELESTVANLQNELSEVRETLRATRGRIKAANARYRKLEQIHDHMMKNTKFIKNKGEDDE